MELTQRRTDRHTVIVHRNYKALDTLEHLIREDGRLGTFQAASCGTVDPMRKLGTLTSPRAIPVV